MLDERLRELERQFQQTGAVEDEVALVRERARAGDLSWERLRLAAYLGHEASAQVAGEGSIGHAGDLSAWISGLSRWGREVIVRAMVVLGRVAADRAERTQPLRLERPEQARRYEDLDRALDALQRWCEAGTEQNRQRAMRAADDDGDFHAIDSEEMHPRIRACARLVRRAVMPLVGGWDVEDMNQFRFELRKAGVDDDEARDRVRQVLIPWALRRDEE